MNASAFIPKEHPEIPDSYGVTITLLSGKTTKYEIAEHHLIHRSLDKEIKDQHGVTVDVITNPHPSPFWQFHTKDDKEILIPMSAIADIEFDSRWAKIVEIKKEMKKMDVSKDSN